MSTFEWSCIRKKFPNINQHLDKITSPIDEDYNCVAWVAYDKTRWWWPDKYGYWPVDVPKSETVASFIAAFNTLGYEICQSPIHEEIYEKLAIYVINDIPKHMARQLDCGGWTSKLSDENDIYHHTLQALEGNIYGCARYFMRRLKSP